MALVNKPNRSSKQIIPMLAGVAAILTAIITTVWFAVDTDDRFAWFTRFSGSFSSAVTDQPVNAGANGQVEKESENLGSIATQHVGEFKFELQFCRHSEGRLACELLITNNSEDTGLKLDRKSRVFDPDGLEHMSSKALLGDPWNNWKKLIQGIPAKGYLAFDSYPADHDLVAVLEVVCYVDQIGWINPQFRKVPISR